MFFWDGAAGESAYLSHLSQLIMGLFDVCAQVCARVYFKLSLNNQTDLKSSVQSQQRNVLRVYVVKAQKLR